MGNEFYIKKRKNFNYTIGYMDVYYDFLYSEISNQEMYNDMMEFILTPYIRNGEFECNEYIIKKMDQVNFIIFSEYIN